MEKDYKPFAITARCAGHPSKLYTPLTVANLRSTFAGTEIAATRTTAMWDTGADVCLISSTLARRLGIKWSKTVSAAGIGESTDTTIGYTYISLVANDELIEVLTGIVDKTSPADEYQFIIGLNLISKGSLAITSNHFGTTLSFTVPAAETIDFTAYLDARSHGYLPLSERMEEQPVVHGAAALAMITTHDDD